MLHGRLAPLRDVLDQMISEKAIEGYSVNVEVSDRDGTDEAGGVVVKLAATRGKAERCRGFVSSLNRPETLAEILNLASDEESGVTIEYGGERPQPFHLLGGCQTHGNEGDELRPGSGIVRFLEGNPDGPGGALTYFLSSRHEGEAFFLGAAHVLTNYWGFPHRPDVKWRCDCLSQLRSSDDDMTVQRPTSPPRASIYRNIKGFPSSEAPRHLGKLESFVLATPLPRLPRNGPPAKVRERPSFDSRCRNYLDAGIVRVANGYFDLKQRTTCFGSFGELPAYRAVPGPGVEVTKCGAEEPHLSFGWVKEPQYTTEVYGPGDPRNPEDREEVRYLFADQILVDLDDPDGETQPPLPFASPGDSGTMVVDRATKQPIGMLFAGSVLTGEYLVTPIARLRKYWEREGLVPRRG